MSGMGDEIHDTWDCEIHRAGIQAMRQRAAELRAELCVSRGLTPSQAEALHAAVQLAEEAVDASPLTPAQRHADELLEALKAMNAGCRDPHLIGLLLSFDMARSVLAKIEADSQEGGAA